MNKEEIPEIANKEPVVIFVRIALEPVSLFVKMLTAVILDVSKLVLVILFTPNSKALIEVPNMIL